MKKGSGIYPHLTVDSFGRKVVSGAGGVLLTRTTTAVGSGCGVERGAGAVAAAVGLGRAGQDGAGPGHLAGDGRGLSG